MLKGIPAIISPELLKVLCEMGHGETIVIADGNFPGESIGNIVLRDRKHLSQDGLIVVVATVNSEGGYIMSGPDIVSRGFVYVRESESLMENARKVALASIEDELKSRTIDRARLKNRISGDLSKYLYAQTKRKPMILPIVMEL